MNEPLDSKPCGQHLNPHTSHRYMQNAKGWQCPGTLAGPHAWAEHYAAKRDQRPAGHTVDTITPDDLDQLYADRDEARAAADRYLTNGTKAVERLHWRSRNAEQRAEQAEAAIARVRALADELETAPAHGGVADGYYEAARRIRAAFDEPGEPRP